MNASKWVGYLEHKTPEMLGYFEENVGKGYCTIFAAMLYEKRRVKLMGLPWCAVFVHAVVDRPDILGKPHPGCHVLQQRMRRKGLWRDRDGYLPVPGDIVFCSNTRTKRVDHCGIVECVDDSTVTSIDGNTIDPSGTFDRSEGGAVARRVRRLDDPAIVGYGAIGGLY